VPKRRTWWLNLELQVPRTLQSVWNGATGMGGEAVVRWRSPTEYPHGVEGPWVTLSYEVPNAVAGWTRVQVALGLASTRWLSEWGRGLLTG
jgi:hypothetical protein